jgi:hypothetical protein
VLLAHCMAAAVAPARQHSPVHHTQLPGVHSRVAVWPLHGAS